MTILDSILTKRQKDAGYYLKQGIGLNPNIYLLREDNILISYPYQSVTIDQIRYDADQAIEWSKSGVTYERPT